MWTEALAMGCRDCDCSFEAMKIKRRAVADYDVAFDLKFCGVCHSDLHFAANHLKNVMPTSYPCVPGHELAGVVTAVGEKVTKLKVGDHVGVGCMVDSCLECKACKSGEEQKCSKQVGTYNGKDWSGRAAGDDDKVTKGGYSSKMVVHERFAISIPKTYPLEAAGPVLCSGITLYDPLKKFPVKKGTKVGIVGLGGLGCIGLKIAKSMGATVTAISRSDNKRELALKCGADDYLVSTDSKAMAKRAKSLDLVVNTIPSYHDSTLYTKLVTGKHVMLGLSSAGIAAMLATTITFGKSKVTFSGIGGIQNTQEVIDLCAKENILPETEVRPVSDLNRIYELIDQTNDAGKRYVLDIANMLTDSDTTDTGPPTKLSKHPESDISTLSILKHLTTILTSSSTWF